jgi:hypothetical protein
MDRLAPRLVAVGMLVVSCGTALSRADVRVIALSGQRADGLVDSSLVDFESPVVAADGRVAYAASFRSHSSTPARPLGIWMVGQSNTVLLGAVGQQAPGAQAGTTFTSMQRDLPPLGRTFSMSRDGEVVTRVGVVGPDGTGSTGYWRLGTAVGPVVRLGDQLETSGVTGAVSFLYYGSAGYPGAGVFNLAVTNGANVVFGVWTDAGGELELLLAEDQTLPGLPAGTTLAESSYVLRVGESAYLFDSRLAGDTVTTQDDAVILRVVSGTAGVVLREGATVAPALTLGEVTQLTAATPERFVFAGEVRGTGVDASNDFVVFAMRDGALRVVAREGDAAPGVGAAERFDSVTTTASIVGRAANVSISQGGDVALLATLTGPTVTTANDTAIWRETSQGLALLLREGDPAPGLANGIRVGQLRRPFSNAFGDILFGSDLVEQTGTVRSNAALWHVSVDGDVRSVLARGQVLAVNPSVPADVRTVRAVNLSRDFVESTAAGPINDAGRIAARVVFTDDSFGIVVIDTGCDSIDFNRNGVFPEDQDVIDFFDVLAGGNCPYAACDIDFNNNGVFPEDQDVIDFFNVLAGGDCR